MIRRMLALFLGGFGLLNLAGEMLRPGFDANLWWIDLRALGPAWSRPLLGFASAALVAWALRPRMGAARRRLTRALVWMLLAASIANCVVFYRLLLGGVIASRFPLPLSLLVAGALAWILSALGKRRDGAGGGAAVPVGLASRWRWGVVPAVGVCVVAFTLAQILCFGKTDYRRKADAIVVFGAGVTPDGRCSQALADRVRTACGLFRDGYASRLILSGGPTPGTLHETRAMRDYAIALGVPANRIVLDPDGINTQATVDNTCDLFERLGLGRVLAVSHFYHLPRIKLTYHRGGREVYTVPAERSPPPLTAMPYFVAREIAAIWVYYLRPLTG